MYNINNNQVTKMEAITFAELGMKESDIEEILRVNIDLVCDEEESMLLVGQQVQNVKLGRSDLTAIDNDGNLVLIEIKRDKKDIAARKESFEFQAIRYAASCATIKSTDELVQNVFAPYVEKHKSEYIENELTSSEQAKRKLEDFLEKNSVAKFNERQRIILVASEFDDQTLSAVAWLNSNQVDISCYQICPYKLGMQVIFEMKKVLPLGAYEDFYVNVVSKQPLSKDKKYNITRRKLPKIDLLLEWGVVKEGAIIVAKGTVEEAELRADGQVNYKEDILSIQKWLKKIFNWSSVATYTFAIDKDSGKSLSELRQAYMEKQNQELVI